MAKQTYMDAGQNPPDGVVVYYYFNEQPQGEVTLTVLDKEGNTVNTFRSKEECSDYKGPFLPKKAGMNRFLWNMRHSDAETVPGDETVGGLDESVNGPMAVPRKL